MIDIYMVFGPPASGKSSLIGYFDEKRTISSGNILRSMGLARKDGTLVEDRIVNKILIENLLNRSDADFIILDGYPRREEQAKFLQFLEKTGVIRLKMFMELSCSDENVIDRSCNRLVCDCGASYHPTLKPSKIENECDKCRGRLQKREDDTPQTIRHRLNIYRSQCNAIRPYFKNIKRFVDVNDNPIESLKEALKIINDSRASHLCSDETHYELNCANSARRLVRCICHHADRERHIVKPCGKIKS